MLDLTIFQNLYHIFLPSYIKLTLIQLIEAIQILIQLSATIQI